MNSEEKPEDLDAGTEEVPEASQTSLLSETDAETGIEAKSPEAVTSATDDKPEQDSTELSAGQDAEQDEKSDKTSSKSQKKGRRSSRSNSSRKEKGSFRSKSRDESNDEEEDDEDVEQLDNLEDLTGIDDPLAPAFDLDRGAPLKPYDEPIPWQSKVSTAKEFFNTEILYRFDIIEPDDIEPLKGTYRIELKGDQGGVWSLNIGNQVDVSNTREEADTVLKMHQRDFLAIVNGKLNPQLAILAQKIKVNGEVKQAIRLQEILAPSSE